MKIAASDDETRTALQLVGGPEAGASGEAVVEIMTNEKREQQAKARSAVGARSPSGIHCISCSRRAPRHRGLAGTDRERDAT